ncbi:predicted protein [Naegleria gruberi]|uniref:Predicted protein n=1 Tax=Naegleria gruberi TaxID=5762 RepID=D2UXN4_NAEGR|nr:uncharacterized protein NAEGRDRAFT_61188 [Naegleria gruberi]EFC50314.1 predicted protein [Naegleria gruberi]|eukprot:XP_002683058.1 predicted protein [Naegleria gruberi strain NEG-M]
MSVYVDEDRLDQGTISSQATVNVANNIEIDNKIVSYQEKRDTIISKILFALGFFLPAIWLISLVWARKTKYREVYRWRRYSIIAFSLLVIVLFCVGWIAIIVFSLIPYPDPSKFNDVMVKSMYLYPGELIAIIWGFLILGVVSYEFIKEMYWKIKKLKQRK